MGTHISKVKSTVLDNWQPAMVARMSVVGNLVGKDIYEHGVPENYPRNFNDQHQLVSWIRNKYEFKKWYHAAADPDLKEDYSDEEDAPAVSNTSATHVAPTSTHAQPQIRFASAPASPAFHETDLFGSQVQNTKPTAHGTQFGEFTSHQSHGGHGDLFASLSPSHAQIGSSISLPSTPVSHASPASGIDLFHTAPSGIPPEQDLFKMQIGPSASAASPAKPAEPKPVDKTLLMNAYNNTPFGVQQQQQQQHQNYLLQQQAYLQQQQLFNQQLFTQGAFSPQPAFGGAAPAAQHPQGQWNQPQQANLFAPQPHHSASHSPASGFAAGPMGATSSPAFAPQAQPQSANGSILASLYAQSPQFAHKNTSPMYPTSAHTSGSAGSPMQYPMTQSSLI